MATIMPQNELLRRALVFISDQMKEKPDLSLNALLDEAGMRFNLGPSDCQDLERLVARTQNSNFGAVSANGAPE